MRKQPPAPPPEAAELVAHLGVAGTMRLIEERGGTRIHVPTPARVDKSFLAAFVGAENLARLSAAMGGSIITVPLCREWRTRLLLHEGGRSHAEIARIVGVTDNWVRKLAATDWTPMSRAHKGLRRAGSIDQLDLPLL